MLGIVNPDENKKYLAALDQLWSTYEIAGVSIVDMRVWKWLYENPTATPEQLKQAVVKIAIEVWNQYYAENFGVKDSPILAIYSHMIAYPLYLADYPLGHIIEYQIHRHIQGKNLGIEMERICVGGKLIPQLWMKNAVGSEIGIQSLLEEAQEALEKMK
jgi:hypothetical protein